MFQHIRTTLKDRKMMRTIFLLAWPTMLEEALQCIVTYADTAQVGVMGANASAAIGLTTTVTWMTFYPMYAAGMSVTSCISIALGAKDTEKAKKAAAQAVLLVLILGLAIMVTTQAFLHIMVSLNIFPETGQNLPLISRGGSSLICTAFAFSLILSVSRTNNLREERQKIKETTKYDE